MQSLEVGIALSTILLNTLQQDRGPAECGSLVAWIDERRGHAGQDQPEAETGP